MPNYNAHIDIGDSTANLLCSPVLQRNLGYFYIGCTAPDIRIITKKKREDYHFASLDFQHLGEGVHGLFREKPYLSKNSNLPETTLAFVSGFITHIISDEVWILSMYRPLFGNRSVFPDTSLGDLMDRALQLEMDNTARLRLNNMHQVRQSIENARDSVELDFISKEAMSMWRNWLLMALNKEFNWERLRFMARRNSDSSSLPAAQELSLKFLTSPSEGLNKLYNHVPNAKAFEYREEAVQKSAQFVGDYLS